MQLAMRASPCRWSTPGATWTTAETLQAAAPPPPPPWTCSPTPRPTHAGSGGFGCGSGRVDGPRPWPLSPPPDAAADAPSGPGLQDSSQPLLIRSRVAGLDAVTEVMLRIESAGSAFGRTQLLRLEPFVVVSNRTGVPMQLLQCRVREGTAASQADAEGAAIAAAARAVEQSAMCVSHVYMVILCFKQQQQRFDALCASCCCFLEVS